jgi:hypothetical protein
MKDQYDKAVAYLTKHPDKIIYAWENPDGELGGRLFQFMGTTDGYGESCGCLTQVKSGIRRAKTPALTKAIRADARIPEGPQWITVNDLPVFAEWQRRLDKELKR